MNASDSAAVHKLAGLVLQHMNDNSLQQARLVLNEFYAAAKLKNTARSRARAVVDEIDDYFSLTATNRNYGDFMIAEDGIGPQGYTAVIARKQNMLTLRLETIGTDADATVTIGSA